MNYWALIIDGKVYEIIDLDPEGRYHPDFIWIPCPEGTQQGMTYEDGEFFFPATPEPTAEEIFANNQRNQGQLLDQAAIQMAPVMVSLQLGDATDEETLLAKSWQNYYRQLKQVDLSVTNPVWPVPPEV